MGKRIGSKVSSSDDVEYHKVSAYSGYYGRHPRTFHSKRDGTMVDAKDHDVRNMSEDG